MKHKNGKNHSYYKYLNIYRTLKQEYAPQDSDYRDIRTLLCPSSGNFSDVGDRGNNGFNYRKLLDSEAIGYLDITSKGLYGGLINPASQWFDIIAKNPEYQNNREAAVYCEDIRRRYEFLFHNTNFYSASRISMKEWPVFGHSPMLIEERDYDVVFFRPFTIGSCYLGIDSDGKYNKLARHMYMTASQIVDQFGYENCQDSVKAAYDSGNFIKVFTVYSLITPNQFNDSGMSLSSDMPYVDLYWLGAAGGTQPQLVDSLIDTNGDFKWLRKGGFYSNPLAVLNWDRKDYSTTYASGIGHNILGDVREVQATTKRGSINEAFATNPALALHSSLGRKAVTPGARFYTEQDPTKVASEIYRVNEHIEVIENKKKSMKERIRSMSMADLMLIFANKNRGALTATEVSAILTEQMVMMAPVYLSAKEWLNSVFERVWDIGRRRKFFPDPPASLRDIKLEPQFISSIAKAQRMAEVGAIQDLVMYVAQLAKVNPEVLDNIDADAIVRDLAIKLGVASKTRSNEQIAQIRKDRAQVQARASQLDNKSKEMKIAKDASRAKLDPTTILGQAMQENGIDIPQEAK